HERRRQPSPGKHLQPAEGARTAHLWRARASKVRSLRARRPVQREELHFLPALRSSIDGYPRFLSAISMPCMTRSWILQRSLKALSRSASYVEERHSLTKSFPSTYPSSRMPSWNRAYSEEYASREAGVRTRMGRPWPACCARAASGHAAEQRDERAPSHSITSSAMESTPDGTSISSARAKLSQGLDLVHVPFNGSAPAIQSALAGHTPIAFTVLTPVVPQVKEGKLRALAVTTPKRSSALPEVPTLAEAGLLDQEADTMQGILVPAGTPERAGLPMKAAKLA